MEKVDHIKSHDRFAGDYDDQVKEYKSYGHNALFGLCYEYVKPGDSLLDLGIGTGLSSVLFARAGLNVTGLDGSPEMLKECEKKGFARELREYNIQDVPFPYADESFSHVICCGVFHFFGDLSPMIGDAVRLLKPGGIFAFTVALLTEKEAGTGEEKIPEHVELPSPWGISVFKHSDRHIFQVTEKPGLEIQKELRVLVNSGDDAAEDMLFKIYVTRKKGV